jgi:hypothetical protein
LRPAQDLADKLARDCRSIMMGSWYRQIFRTRLAVPPQCRAGVHHNHIFELFRRLAEAAEQRRKPQPTQTVYAPGSME